MRVKKEFNSHSLNDFHHGLYFIGKFAIAYCKKCGISSGTIRMFDKYSISNRSISKIPCIVQFIIVRVNDKDASNVTVSFALTLM